MIDGSRRRAKRRPNVATVLALIALFVALGGTSLGAPVRDAATSLAHRVTDALHTSHHAEATARRALKESRQAVATANAANAKTGATGPQGPTGATGATGAAGRPGAQGSALGYAALEYCPGPNQCLDQDQAGWYAPDDDALGVDNTANFEYRNPGVFCFHALPFHAHNVVANIGPSATPYIVQATVGTTDHPITNPPCPTSGADDQNAVVEVRDPSTGNLVDPDHAVRLMIAFN